VNQGHCHPKILQALVDQASRLTLSSRAFYNDMYGQYAKFVTEYFGYDMVLPMFLSLLNVIDYRNTGAEAVETGIKLARRWGYVKKGIPVGQAIVFSAEGNFHGRTIGVVSMSTDPESRDYHGPFLPLVGATVPSTGKTIRYNNIQDLEEAFERHGDNIAAFLIEPIQGEAGYILPRILLTLELLSQMTTTFLKFENYARNTTSSLSRMKFKPELQEQGKCYAWNIGTSNPMSFSSEKQSQEASTPSAQSSQVEI
jgi:acetylornithine/succinyldiaminopimelate/putrescine aminotransferase